MVCVYSNVLWRFHGSVFFFAISEQFKTGKLICIEGPQPHRDNGNLGNGWLSGI